MGKRTRTTIIRDNPDDEQERLPVARESEEDSGEQSFSDFMAKNKGLDGCRVKIRRQTQQGREYCGSFQPEEIENAEEFLRLYHAKQDYANEAGVYYVSVEVNGETRSVFPIRIAPQSRAAISPAVPQYGSMADQGLRDSIARLESRIAQQERPPMMEMVDGLAKLDQLRGGQGGGNMSMDTIVKCIEIGTRMGGGGGTGGGSDSWEGMLREVVKDNAPALIGLLQLGAAKLAAMTSKPAEQPAAQPQPPTNPNPPVVEETMDTTEQEKAILAQAIGWLKKKSAAHSDPGLYVDLIVDNREDPLYAKLISKITENDFSTFANSIDPEIAKPEHADFFGFIYDRVRRVFKPANTVAGNTGGKGGHKSNAESNGGPGKSGGK